MTLKNRILSICLVFSLLCLCVFTGFSCQAAPEVSADSAILMTADTGMILVEKNAFEERPIASTTKIMTAMLALEYPALDEWFTVDENAIQVEGSSMGLRPGDQVTMRGLVYGMLLSSGNDAANAAAVKISGSIPAFVDKMNAKAQELGMKHTHFATPSGLDKGEEHYSTAYDMALLAKEALKNPDFVQICSSKTAQVEYGNPPYKRWLKNHNRLLKEYPGAIGVKTGFTKKAGRCLVSAAERDGVRLIAVVLNAPNDWSDSKALLDYGFSSVSDVKLDVDFSQSSIHVVGGAKGDCQVQAQDSFSVSLPIDKESDIVRKVYLDPFYYAPIEMGEEVGYATYQLNGEIIYSIPLYAAENVTLE